MIIKDNLRYKLSCRTIYIQAFGILLSFMAWLPILFVVLTQMDNRMVEFLIFLSFGMGAIFLFDIYFYCYQCGYGLFRPAPPMKWLPHRFLVLREECPVCKTNISEGVNELVQKHVSYPKHSIFIVKWMRKNRKLQITIFIITTVIIFVLLTNNGNSWLNFLWRVL